MTTYIGIAGTHSTGKTTFVDAWLERASALGLKVGKVSDTATRCQDAGFSILRNHTFESTLWIMTSVIRSELEAGLASDLVLVDRPVPDALGYLEAALQSTGRSISDQERRYLYDLAALHSKRYALLFKTELDEAIPLGAGRDPNLEFRSEVNRQIGTALKQLGLQWSNPATATSAAHVGKMLLQLASEQK